MVSARILQLLACCLAALGATEQDAADAKSFTLGISLPDVSKAFRYALKSVGKWPQQREPKRVEVALVGFGRTGTTSMVAALDVLGYRIQHDDSLLEVSDLHGRLAAKDDPFTIDDFVRACGKRGFDGIFFYSDEFIEWAARTENVKVLLTKRDSGRKWAESWLAIAPNVDSLSSRPFIWFRTVRDLLPGYFELIYKHISTQGQPEKYKDLETLAAAHDAHLAKVRKMVPRNRLLEFNVKEGWGPLCEFLDKPVPDAEFPRVNKRIVAQMIVGALVLITWIWPLAPVLAAYMMWRLARFFAFFLGLLPTGTDKKQA